MTDNNISKRLLDTLKKTEEELARTEELLDRREKRNEKREERREKRREERQRLADRLDEIAPVVQQQNEMVRRLARASGIDVPDRPSRNGHDETALAATFDPTTADGTEAN